MSEPGTIKFRDRIKQIISFIGIVRRRGVRPMDIDGFIDYKGNSFVYIEEKLDGIDIEKGQKEALEHVVNSHTTAGNVSCAVLFKHNTPKNEDVIMKDAQV